MILDIGAAAFLAFCGIKWRKKGVYPVLKTLGKWGILFCLAFVLVTSQRADELLSSPVVLFLTFSGLGTFLSSQLALILFKVILLIVSLLFLEWLFDKKKAIYDENREHSWSVFFDRAGGMFFGLLAGVLWLLILQFLWLFYQGGQPESFWIQGSSMFFMGENVLQNFWYFKDTFSLPSVSLEL